MLAFFLYLISKEDLRSFQIPDEYSLSIAILAVGAGGFSLNRVNLSLFIILLTSLVSGLGDAKLFGAITLLLGTDIIWVILLSFVFASFFCLVFLIREEVDIRGGIAFAPYISVSAYGIWLFRWIIRLKNML